MTFDETLSDRWAPQRDAAPDVLLTPRERRVRG
jgi:hypothetical protein